MNMPSWAVVATVDEPAPLIIAFAAHYLAMGASAVHLFLDRPNPAAQAALAAMARLHITVCDDAHWAALPRRKRPGLHVGRQTENAKLVFGQTRADWLFLCDCDEFLRDGAALGRDLADQPRDVSFMRVPVAERVLRSTDAQAGIFDGMFRRPIALFEEVGPAIYGADADFYKKGMTGHAIGKSALRVGADLEISIHGPLSKLPEAQRAARPQYGPIGGAGLRSELLHFDGLTDLHYALKLLRRAAEPVFAGKPRHGAPRSAQIAKMAQLAKMAQIAGDAAAVMALVARLKRLTPRQYKALLATDYLDSAGFDPSGAVAALGLKADFSCAAFDVELRARDADFIAKSGLAIKSGLGI